ncbi:MAG: hypothetical protein M1481_06835 [Candidatus Thermoplasmatota archaeon]|jgi:hypothetical protein|nr:hypothetical protein [Candidatus Thermoplasmatota archaeon]MCL5964094.1 hypothetical protein [Candidatus Thermoplasmatota archaeon]
MSLITCQNCGFKFSVSYGRVTACNGCPSSYIGDCYLVKCPKCGEEFEKDAIT